ncbi:palmitoyltransferase ZDHHC15A-like [Biomphalaria glabrata]|uniref:Palmitoyltransferase n=1 Tax=Biomphalaria glabrata TaxID=6526 RepID=A0A9W2ZA59_BIOGL|nr:palmitoyltransferase ZDHHC15A-like [Biomphalaria glabrata]XP_055871898.1 palmitoyltransferase ZDHHC15A-like [Biomphalaria glabrata]XP_055871899.1 palmitoyltransferase ZDHHC15A-like [Biomphalaria glabrata]
MLNNQDKMATSLKWKLRAISIFCQVYVFLFCILTLLNLFYVTIPTICSSDSSSWLLKTVALCVIGNTLSNYICLRYTAYVSTIYLKQLRRSKVHTDQYTMGTLNRSSNDLDVKAAKSQQDLSFFVHLTNSLPPSTPINNNDLETISSYKYQSSESIFFLDTSKNWDKRTPRLLEDWHMCSDCKMLSPPRARHCHLCHVCVLKRDHHCFFSNCCVGFHNQRYFIFFCFYAALGTLLNTIATFYYLDQHYSQLQTWGYLAYTPPVLLYFWINNSVNNALLTLLAFQYFSTITTLACFYYFVTQFFLACAGMTMHEYAKNINEYRGTIWSNLYSVFGKYWLINVFIPMPSLGYTSDGISWDRFFNTKVL